MSSRKSVLSICILWFGLHGGMLHGQIQNFSGIDQTPLVISKFRAVDMDLDGDKELVLLNHSKKRVECYENLGSGNFAPLRTITRLEEQYTKMEIGNFIGGQAPDILLHGLNATSMLLEGSGNLSFVNRPQELGMSLSVQYTNYSPHDLDGDGYDEFAWVQDTEVKLWKGSQDGLEEHVIHTTSELLYSASAGGFIHHGDFNNDGLLDLVCSNGSFVNDVVVLLNQGDLNFSTVVSVGPVLGSSRIPPADINNDGNLDLFHYPTTDACWVSLGDGQGGFGAPSLLGNSLRFLSMGDYNNDGIMDFVSSHPIAPVCSGSTSACNHVILLWTGNGNATFTSQALHTHFHGTSQLQLLECTGDERLDIVFIGQKIGTNIFVGSPEGFPPTPELVGSLLHDVRDMEFYDADGDGLLDIVFTDFGTLNPNYSRVLGGLSIMKNLGGGRWSHETQLTVPSINSSSSSAMGDFDHDGIMDVFYKTPDMRIRHGKLISDELTEEPLLNPYSLEDGFNLIVADIIGDEVKELFTGGATSTANCGFYRYNGSSWYRTLISNSSGSSLYFSSDIDQDGTENIIYFRSSGNRISYVPQTMEEPVVPIDIRTGLPVVPDAIYSFDYDNDGDPDIIYRSNNELFWLRNNGTFPFGAPEPAELYGVIPTFRALLFDDLNSDQFMDLVILTNYQVIIRFNQTDGTTSSEVFDRSFPTQNQAALYSAHTSDSTFKDIFIVCASPNVVEAFYLPSNLSVCQNPSACNYSPGATPFGENCILPSLTDFNCSGNTDVADMLFFISQFGCIEVCTQTDLNGDSIVNLDDLIILLGQID